MATVLMTLLGSTAHAESIDSKNLLEVLKKPAAVSPILEKKDAVPIPIIQKKQEPKVTKYKIQEGDNLTKIAELHETTVERLWEKNVDIENQDLLTVGQEIVIPEKAEELTDRPFTSKPENTSEQGGLVNSSRLVAGNAYEPGQCTWHVKNLAPWVSNSWGNATDWAFNARRDGYSVSNVPRAGAVAWRYGHVAYVVAVNGDGTVTISEMNYNWVAYSQRTIQVDTSTYQYIY